MLHGCCKQMGGETEQHENRQRKQELWQFSQTEVCLSWACSQVPVVCQAHEVPGIVRLQQLHWVYPFLREREPSQKQEASVGCGWQQGQGEEHCCVFHWVRSSLQSDTAENTGELCQCYSPWWELENVLPSRRCNSPGTGVSRRPAVCFSGLNLRFQLNRFLMEIHTFLVAVL